MAISEVCKFELKAMVDKVKKEKSCSRNKALSVVANECDIPIETARTKDKRARKELVQIEPTKSKVTEIVTNSTPAIIENRQPQGGGARAGAGRPQSRDPLEVVNDIDIPEDKDSKILYHLKRYWKQSTKKDKKEFRRWIDES
jgi:hypothetical protein